MPKYLGDVRCWVKSGNHMLSLSFSGFDPNRTSHRPKPVDVLESSGLILPLPRITIGCDFPGTWPMSDFELPVTRYAVSGNVNIAYQTMGSGPVDVVLVPGVVTHVEFLHEIPGYTASL